MQLLSVISTNHFHLSPIVWSIAEIVTWIWMVVPKEENMPFIIVHPTFESFNTPACNLGVYGALEQFWSIPFLELLSGFQRKLNHCHPGEYIQRVDFKVATIIHQSLSGISPPYLADGCHLVADAREQRLRSTASWTCVVTWTYNTFGDRAFGAAGPGLWNSLASHLKDADISYSEFHRSLKTFLFGQWGHGAVWTVLIAPIRNILTYLLTYLYIGCIRNSHTCGVCHKQDS